MYKCHNFEKWQGAPFYDPNTCCYTYCSIKGYPPLRYVKVKKFKKKHLLPLIAKVSTQFLCPSSTFVPKAPFPSRLANPKREDQDEKILETFKKAQVNIPLLDVVKQISRYASFSRSFAPTRGR